VTRYVARPGAQRFERFSWQAVRWMQVSVRGAENGLRLHRLGALATHHAVEEEGAFYCDDATLTRLWRTRAHTLKQCAHDAREDCPGREQRQWLGDVRVENLAGAAAYGTSVHALTAKYLCDVADSQRLDGLTACRPDADVCAWQPRHQPAADS